MKIFGRQVWGKAAVGSTVVPYSALGESSSWWRTIGEAFTGAWQRNIVVETQKNLLAFSAVYACVNLIAGDIAKLRPRLMQLMETGVWREADRNSPHWRTLRKPNSYQTYVQFFLHWIVCKLLHGNTYTLKERDNRGMVIELHILDPRLVTLLVTPDGGVYYQLKVDHLTRGLQGEITIPASEIIHDRGFTPWHPLIGVSPIYACGASGTQGIRIQNNSAQFFANMSRPSGHLTAPGEITDANAARMKAEFENNFSGSYIGRLLVTGDGLKYEPISMPAVDSQLIDQLKWTVEDVARCFGVPLHKLATGENPKFSNVGAMNQDYYSQTLQLLVEAIEILLDEGLELGRLDANKTYGVEFDLSGMLRMDPATRAEANAKLVGAGIKAPNEARLEENLPPVEGGDTPYLQVQNYSLEQLAKRPALTDAPAVTLALPAPKPPVMDEPEGVTPAMEEESKAMAEAIIKKFIRETANG